MQPKIEILGVRSLAQALDRLPKELQRIAETSALREAFKPVLKTARAGALKHKDTGLLAKSIGLTVRKGRKNRNYTVRVGARTGFRQLVTRNGKQQIANPVNYAHLVEYGTSTTPARAYIRPAVTSNQSAIMDGLAKGYDKGLDKAVKKLRRK